MESETNLAELDKLVRLFYPDVDTLGSFREVTTDEIPTSQRSLLDHNLHMTVTLEKFCGSPVDVTVLQEEFQGDVYCREICLNCQSNQKPVQYGIVRLNFKQLSDEVQSEVRSQKIPLGRILIEHDVHRRVQLLSLYEIEPSAKLAAVGDRSNHSDKLRLYGRTAIIYCNHEPAIELLEIVLL